MRKNSVSKYNYVARCLHWFSALIIISMFGVGLWMVDLNYYSTWYQTAPHWHKSVGILFAGLTIFRLIWKHLTVSPKIDGNRIEVYLATAGHIAMYALLFGLFVSGYLISTSDGRSIDVFNWFSIPGSGELFTQQSDIAGKVHFYIAWTLIFMVLLHVLAALKHHFINKDNTLRKMIGESK
ncbi:cytochrome b [Photobacterium damselae]|uniref:cytochrome b n=1 Tax=Photobacterium damselae TaxID=38293 RepID=UPI0010FE6D2F|nr:cytochrome b [Photobacterium damselae]TLS72858.1 cytochrome b [Photobacterium damselae subsp. damselae]